MKMDWTLLEYDILLWSRSGPNRIICGKGKGFISICLRYIDCQNRVREILIRSHSFISFCGSWILLKHKGSGYRSSSKIKKIEIEDKICFTFVQVVSDFVKLQNITSTATTYYCIYPTPNSRGQNFIKQNTKITKIQYSGHMRLKKFYWLAIYKD